MSTTVLRLPEVKGKVGLSRSTIYLRVSQGTFPAPIHIGDRAVGWLESEVESWLREQVSSSRKVEGDNR